ncbi:MAG: hypothetical protein AB8C84_06830 [Oligoflexales bacterium]
MRQKYRKWERAWFRFKDRQDHCEVWLPYPAFISFTLAIILTFHMLVGLNPKLGNPSNVLPLMSEPEKKGSLWISVSLQGQQTIITTAHKDVFRWSSKNPQIEQISLFKKALKQMIEDKILSAGLAMQGNQDQSLMTIAVDQAVQYRHLEPLLMILAETGIAEYGLETRQIRKS